MDEKDAEIERLQAVGLDLVGDKMQLGVEIERLRAALRDMLNTYAPTAAESGIYGTHAVARAVRTLNSGTVKDPARPKLGRKRAIRAPISGATLHDEHG